MSPSTTRGLVRHLSTDKYLSPAVQGGLVRHLSTSHPVQTSTCHPVQTYRGLYDTQGATSHEHQRRKTRKLDARCRSADSNPTQSIALQYVVFSILQSSVYDVFFILKSISYLLNISQAFCLSWRRPKKSTSNCFCKTFFFYSGSSLVVIILYLGRSHIVFVAYLSISPAGRLCPPGEKRKKQSNCDLSSAPLIAFVQQPWDLKYEQDYAITQRKYK